MKKLIAPLIVAILVIIYYVFYFALIIFAVENIIAKVLLGIIPVALSGVMLHVLIQRFKEIKGGEEDDLSKY